MKTLEEIYRGCKGNPGELAGPILKPEHRPQQQQRLDLSDDHILVGVVYKNGKKIYKYRLRRMLHEITK